jgi:hypothetical protein
MSTAVLIDLSNVKLSGTSLQTAMAAESGGTIHNNLGQYHSTTLTSGANTYALNGLISGAAQRGLWVVKQPSSGNSATVTITGAVTPGGTPLELSHASNAVDVIEWFTPDGTTLYAQVLFKSSVPAVSRVTLGTAFTSSAAGTSGQNVTGFATWLPVGSYNIRARVPILSNGFTSTQTLDFSFSGSATCQSQWILAYSAGSTGGRNGVTLGTFSPAATMSVNGVFAAYDAVSVVVTTAGTLQLQMSNGTTAQSAIIPVGAYMEIERTA